MRNVDTKQVESCPVCEIMNGTAAKPMRSPCEALEAYEACGAYEANAKSILSLRSP